ncbi:helix-turn-helix domain-containing protein [Granulicella aggregans]
MSVHPVTILRWAREGRIPFFRLGRRVAFRASQLNEWLATAYTGIAVRAA